MLKKVLIISLVVVVVLGIGGYYGINYVFSKFFFMPSITSLESAQPASTSKPNQGVSPNTEGATNTPQSENADKTSDNAEKTGKSVSSDSKNSSQSSGNKAMDSVAKVAKSPALAKSLENEINIPDKARVMSIVLSVFSSSEVQRFYAMAADGITPSERSEMMGAARKRFSSQQKKELMEIYTKYLEDKAKYSGR